MSVRGRDPGCRPGFLTRSLPAVSSPGRGHRTLMPTPAFWSALQATQRRHFRGAKA